MLESEKRQPVLSLRDVSVHFFTSTEPVLSEISFDIFEGERVALLGLNGSGKSTLLSSIVGLVSFGGIIRVAGKELSERTLEDIRQSVGFLFSIPEDQILFPKVIDDVAFTLIRRRTEVAEAKRLAAQVLEQLDSRDLCDRPPDELSHGQRLRVALAGAVIASPVLLLLDEPSAGLDPRGVRVLSHYLRSLPSSILIATHDLPFAAWVCDRFILLEDGHIKLSGSDFKAVEAYWELGAFGDSID